MKQFEQNPVEKINLEKSPEISSEYSPEMIDFLKGMREKFVHFLKDFKDEIPKEIIHGELEYKCQRNWFTILTSVELMSLKLKQNSKIDELSKQGIILAREVAQSELTTKEQIDRGNAILEAVNKELDRIIGE